MKKTINTLLICLIVINIALSEENTENIQLELKKGKNKRPSSNKNIKIKGIT